MAITYVEIEDRYQTQTQSENVTVEVTIGDAGVGAYIIFLDKVLKAANTTANLGKASEVIGKRTIISATIPDTLDETNWTSVTVYIKEGSQSKTYGPYSKHVSNNLDTVNFIIQIINQ
ncbi:MAG TPA: hypothetical protein VIM65_14730 [Cyclobacteriaceae bacterium]